MGFIFRISSIIELPAAKTIALDGVLEEGCILPGSKCFIEGVEFPITIKSYALVNPPNVDKNFLILSIERPDIPLSSIRSGMLLKG